MKTGHHTILTQEQRTQLQRIEEMTDDQIDLSDMPERGGWSGAERGKFHRPVKQQLTVRFDADVVDWFRQHGDRARGYQTRMNAVLRAYMTAHTSG